MGTNHNLSPADSLERQGEGTASSAALQHLSDLDWQDKRRRYKSVPDFAIPRRRFSDKTANDLTKAIIRYVDLMGGYATRIQSQGQYNDRLKRWTKGTTRKGTADIHAVVNGLHLSIEVKIGRDRMSQAQRQTAEQISRAGGRYFVAGDFQSFYNWFIDLPSSNPVSYEQN